MQTTRSRAAAVITMGIALLGAALAGCGGMRDPSRPASPTDCQTRSPRSPSPAAGSQARAVGGMGFTYHGTNQYVHASDDRKSTFSVDADTASYTMMRRYVRRGQLPPLEAVRTEEFINAMDYGYAGPSTGAVAIHTEMCPAPFRNGAYLLRVALQGRRIHPADRKPADITLVIDVSGSMAARGKLDLVAQAAKTLLNELGSRDRVAIVSYNTRATRVMDLTRVDDRGVFTHAIAKLRPGGRTSVWAGLREGLAVATAARDAKRVNRVILFSDGVANTDYTRSDDFVAAVRAANKKGVRLTTIGVGLDNYNDTLLEQLADNGDGNYHYLDTVEQAENVLGRNFVRTNEMIARNVKVQVAFNDDTVARYRLMGYENRAIADGDFTSKSVDGGDMGAGQTVTALYAVELRSAAANRKASETVATVRVRYLKPDGWWAQKAEAPVRIGDIASAFSTASDDTRLAVTAAHYAEWLRDTYWAGRYTLANVQTIGRTVRTDARGRSNAAELLELLASAAGHTRPSRVNEQDEETSEARWWGEPVEE